MVKRELSSSGTDTDESEPQTPLAVSTQKTPPKQQLKHNSTDSSDDDEIEGTPLKPDDPASETLTSLSSKTLQTSKEKYLSKFPFVRPSKAKYCVDIDLTDSSDEVYIVKCPSSVDARKVLMRAKLETLAFGSVSKICSPQDLGGTQLEGVLTKNSALKPVTVMAGTEFKSFVPVGTIQIRETLEEAVPLIPVKSELSVEDEIPFPEDIRERHPLLGVDYQLAQRLPKHVKKALSLAQQRSDAFYLQKEEEMVAVTMKPPEVKSKKRKHEDILDYVDSADETIKLMIKEEARSPSPRKKKLKKESPTTAAQPDDDLSWLNEM